jgi:hypothetical protein
VRVEGGGKGAWEGMSGSFGLNDNGWVGISGNERLLFVGVGCLDS